MGMGGPHFSGSSKFYDTGSLYRTLLDSKYELCFVGGSQTDNSYVIDIVPSTTLITAKAGSEVSMKLNYLQMDLL